jgi:hypothetical protein
MLVIASSGVAIGYPSSLHLLNEPGVVGDFGWRAMYFGADGIK